MKNTHLLGRLHSFVLRGFVVALFGLFSTVAFAQTEFTNIVDASIAADRLSTHFPAIQAAYNSMSITDPNYAFETARVELTMHVYEDVLQGIEPASALHTRFDEGMGAPSPQGVRPTMDEASATGANPPTVEYDPIVAELVNLLQQ